MSAGYSGTPLAKKLGFKSGLRVFVDGAPASYLELVSPLPENIVFIEAVGDKPDIIHLFTDSLKGLTKKLTGYVKKIHSYGTIWVSWPKKASKVPTDVTEDRIRELAISLGWVDVKVCAVDEVWSGLKLVVPLKDR
ncbi:MAG: DUF3052 family protein [Gemmataceae bacterium]|nr:DUF3052 family protein [Gemmataceae bacterium]